MNICLWLPLVLRQAGFLLMLLSAFCSMDVCASTLLIAVRDVRDATPIYGATIVCAVAQTLCDMKQEQQGQYVAQKVIVQPDDLIHLEIQSGSQYIERKITISGSVITGTPLVVYMAKKLPQYTFQYLDSGLAYHKRGEFDRALAHYEAAYFASETSQRGITQFDVNLKYNYARSITNTCLRIDYDTCADAKNLWIELTGDAVKYRNLFDNERINIPDIAKTIRDIDAKGASRQYASFKELFSVGNYVAAAQEGENLIEQLNQQPTAFSDVRLTKDRLKEDLGTAYYRAAISTDTVSGGADSKQLLDNSYKHFSEIAEKNEGVTRDIQVIEQRLSKLEN